MTRNVSVMGKGGDVYKRQPRGQGASQGVPGPRGESARGRPQVGLLALGAADSNGVRRREAILGGAFFYARRPVWAIRRNP